MKLFGKNIEETVKYLNERNRASMGNRSAGNKSSSSDENSAVKFYVRVLVTLVLLFGATYMIVAQDQNSIAIPIYTAVATYWLS